MQRYQPRGRIGQHVEVGGGWGAHGGGTALSVHLVVDETPLLQESVDAAEKRGSDPVGGGETGPPAPRR